MPLPKKILVPTDFTETSDAALDYAVALAGLTGGSVTLLHVYEIPTTGFFPDRAMMASGDVARKIRTSSADALASRVSKRKSSGVPMRTVLHHGDACEEINIVAADVDADLVVIGTHARRGLARALLGSVAENVIRTATRPVLTIHGLRDDAN